MATFTLRKRVSLGNMSGVLADIFVAKTETVPEGGIPISAADFGLGALSEVLISNPVVTDVGDVYTGLAHLVGWERTTSCLRIFWADKGHNHTFTGAELATHQHAAITAGTPAGTVAAPVFTGAELATHQHAAITAGTPAGTVAAPVFTGAELATHQHAVITAGTPAGTVAAPVFTGAALATHQHAAITAGTPAGTVAAPVFTGAEMATHIHAAITAGTPAGTVAAPVFSGAEMATHQHAAITAGTPAGTMVPKYEVMDLQGITKPVIALTHNADPVLNLAAAALYLVEDQGQASVNIGRLESNNAGFANIAGETANGEIYTNAASCRFFVLFNATPAGVPIYIAEDTSDQLEFVSPTAADCWIVMPFECVAGVPAGAAVAVRLHHAADAATGKALYFDDNGLADAQLIFVDAGTAGGVIPAADITILRPIGVYDEAANLGAFTGAELGTHQHAAITAGTPAGTNDAPVFTGAAMATHQHAAITAGTPAGTNNAPVFTGAEMATHIHAAITAGTPAGTNDAPVFTGAELATHQHAAITAGTPAGTNDAPVFTGAEMATHIHAAITAGTPAGTNSAPAFTGAEMATHIHAAITAGTPAGTVSTTTDAPAEETGEETSIEFVISVLAIGI